MLRPDGVYVSTSSTTRRCASCAPSSAHCRSTSTTSLRSRRSPLFDGAYGGNVVLVAANEPLDDETLRNLVTSKGNVLLTGAELERLVDDAPVITDDFAPIDQWLDRDKGGE